MASPVADVSVTTRTLGAVKAVEFLAVAGPGATADNPTLVVVRAIADWIEANPDAAPMSITFDYADDADEVVGALADHTATDWLMAVVRDSTFTVTAVLVYEE